ncbi:acrosomal protein SP-10 isoform X2 [Otolemur garnettii]|uniref:acrosomal protein SP-10 isoform X2 n=1 Tax=Otolemur garnettii TaxID=30611 RepID=UPI00064417AE|nr:acrosomal protein SP-10 isoform X2 [Otolemur garnettii]
MNKFLLLMSLYLLGYAREASGQPDELPGSMNHKASVQQLSGEYFPLANPPDAEALYESSNDNTLSEHGSSEHGSNEHNVAEHSSGEHATGEHTSVEHSTSEHSSEQPSGEQPSAEKSSGEHSEHASSEQPSGEHAAGEQPSGEQPSGEQPSGEQPSGEQASGEQASGVLLNCHTCAYMNDQGKCLRGEGICTTQNSQQCMLKKIFEGGKLQFMVQGCENMCPSMNLFSHGTRMQIICCRNRPFCNKI